MTFPGKFVDQLLPDQLANLSVSFLVDDLDVRRGGVAGNICFGLGVLGLHPVLIGAVGADFGDYRSWLETHGVDTSGVRVSETRQTARFTCTTDTDQNQIASFYPGAMSEAREIDLGLLGQLDMVLVGPNDPSAMMAHTDMCRNRSVPFAADPSQQLASLDGAAIRKLLDGAEILFCNAYEAALLESKTGLSGPDVLGIVGTRITTHGADGVHIERSGEAELRVGVVRATRLTDPTGVGDAFRAGFLAGRSWDLSLERSAQIGALMATLCVESLGPQEYDVDPETARTRLTSAYGADAAAEICAHLS
jgi:adenosine kinase